MDRPTCNTCDWYLPGRSGRGVCGFAPPVAGVVGALDSVGGGAMDGVLQAQTLRPEVAATSPCCVRHPKAQAWQAALRAAEVTPCRD